MKHLRNEVKKVKIGDNIVFGDDKVYIQSMCDIKTSNVNEVIKQINECEAYGADLMRVSILDEEDANSIKEIVKNINIPLVADIHFDYKLALIALDNGISKIRINPGNIGSIDKIKAVVNKCKEKHVPMRIGVNSGSMDKDIYSYDIKLESKYLVESAKRHVEILESLEFYDIIISLKASNAIETINAYREASKIFPYPLHLGITEAGIEDISIIRSAAALSPLLLEGIGNTIRISMTDEPKKEVIVAKRLLHDLNLYPNYPTLISCPTCGRTKVNVKKLATKILNLLEKTNKNITVAVMGCIVNGPGEAKNSDIGVAGGDSCYVIFKKGKIVKTVKEDEIYNELKKEIEKM